MDWKEYNIEPGEQNFSPQDPLGLLFNGDFEFWVVFHHSCYYSQADWFYDPDWYDVNKLAMLTQIYTPNNYLAYGAGFMPGNFKNKILVTPYTNYPGSDWQTKRSDSLAVDTYDKLQGAEALHGVVRRKRNRVDYTFGYKGESLSLSHNFKLPWWALPIFRRTGTYMGGENNSQGEYGGKASQKMKLWLKFQKL